eukprot:6175173-Pleurochrysis_carterae.AAC.4
MGGLPVKPLVIYMAVQAPDRGVLLRGRGKHRELGARGRGGRGTATAAATGSRRPDFPAQHMCLKRSRNRIG